jgi:hypothetical protein
LPTVVRQIEVEKDAWKDFRRALRKEEQEAFDALWRLCRRHAAPISMASRPVPNDAMVMAMLVGIMRFLMRKENPDGKDLFGGLDI